MYREIFANISNGQVIIKPSVDGMSGVGVQKFYRQGTNIYANKDITLSVDYLNNICGRDIILQEAVTQHEYINQFNRTSVNTLRLSMYRSVVDDKCHILGAILRIGSKGSIVDNAHAGGCYVGINPDGTFCHEVLDQYGQKKRIFNGIDFSEDFRYPNWESILEFGKSIGKFVPHHRLLALDIVLTKEGTPQLIEFNSTPGTFGTWVFQFTTGPALGKFTDEIIGYCKRHQSNNKKIIYI